MLRIAKQEAIAVISKRADDCLRKIDKLAQRSEPWEVYHQMDIPGEGTQRGVKIRPGYIVLGLAKEDTETIVALHNIAPSVLRLFQEGDAHALAALDEYIDDIIYSGDFEDSEESDLLIQIQLVVRSLHEAAKLMESEEEEG